MTMMKNHQNAGQGLAAMFRGQVSVQAGGVAMPDAHSLPQSPEAAAAVESACSMEYLGGVFAASVDQDGNSQPARFINTLPAYTVLGGGTQGFKERQTGAVKGDLTGVIVRIADYRVLWQEVQEGKNAPTCASLDGETGYGDPGGACRACPMARYDGPGVPYCKKRARVYIALQETGELACIDLTAMSREGLAAFRSWVGAAQSRPDQWLVRVRLVKHPRSGTGNNQTSLVQIDPLARADDGGTAYNNALAQATAVLKQAEQSWLEDVALPPFSQDVSYADRQFANVPASDEPLPLDDGAIGVLPERADGFDWDEGDVF